MNEPMMKQMRQEARICPRPQQRPRLRRRAGKRRREQWDVILETLTTLTALLCMFLWVALILCVA